MCSVELVRLTCEQARFSFGRRVSNAERVHLSGRASHWASTATCASEAGVCTVESGERN